MDIKELSLKTRNILPKAQAKKGGKHFTDLEIAGGHRLSIFLFLSKRCSIRLSLNDDGHAHLAAPFGISHTEIDEFIDKHSHWLIHRYQQWQAKQQQNSQCIYIFGTPLPVQRSQVACDDDQQDTNQQSQIIIEHDRVIIPDVMASDTIFHNLYQQLKRQALPLFQQRIDTYWPAYQEISGDFQSRQPVLKVKYMKTRWGSLSKRGYINLNCALMHYPSSVLDMVVVHELCHLSHFNHSRAFYQLMSRIKPDWQSDNEILKNRTYLYSS